MRKKAFFLICFLIIILVVGVDFFYIRQRSVNEAKTYVVWVNGEGIKRADYRKELTITTNFFKWAKQNVSQLSTLDNDVLTRMIEMKLVSQYARKNRITVSQTEIDTRYQAGLGKKAEDQFLMTVKAMYGMDKADYQQKLVEDLLREKVQMKLDEPLAAWLQRMKVAANLRYSAIIN